jgi:DNA repair protein RadA/Sms
MSKIKSAFFCSNCGYESAKWLGKCPSCNTWNSFIEEVVQKDTRKSASFYKPESNNERSLLLEEITSSEVQRIVTSDKEFNRVLGGGIVPGSITLIAGEPGIGKSTLLLQNGLLLSHITIMYVSGEESQQQIKMRADRLKISHNNFFVSAETQTQSIFQEVSRTNAGLLIIDSIQTIHSPYIDASPGSISQVKESAAELQRFAKETGIPVIMIGHITKDGTVAGPKILEHMVDVVLQFEGDRHYAYRILRTMKNRFGSSAELGIYEMRSEGMRPVNNPSEILITQKEDRLSGIAIGASIEGMRPLLLEVQSLVTQSVYGTPQRTVSGFDLRRLQLLLAVLEKRGGFHFGVKDVFVNIAGGLKVEDPSIDMAVIAALLSSFEDVPLPHHTCFAGEVGLSGEVRAVNRVDQRISEAEKLGFEKIIVSKYNQLGNGKANERTGIQVVSIGTVEELYRILF